MRCIKLCLVVGLILAVSGTAEAITFNQSYNGTIMIKLKNYDTGVSYPVSSAVGIAAVDGIVGQTPATNAWNGLFGNPLIPAGYAYAGQAEDAWMALKVTSIETPGGTQLWSDGDGGQELVGMMYGLVDVAVGAGGMAVLSDGFNLDLYEQTAGIFNPALGTGGRTGFSTYTGATGGTNLLSAVAVPGIGINDLAALDPTTFGGQLPQFSHRSFVAQAGLYLDIISGPWDQLIAPNSWTDPWGGGAVADLFATANFVYNDGSTTGGIPISDWDYLSNDPTRAYYVPEPLTMLAVFTGIAGLGGYIRKRRMA